MMGGVIVSLVDDVEYDVSLKLDVVCLEFDVLLLFAPKEQKIKKNTT